MLFFGGKEKYAKESRPATLAFGFLRSRNCLWRGYKLATFRQFIPFSPQSIAPLGCVEWDFKSQIF